MFAIPVVNFLFITTGLYLLINTQSFSIHPTEINFLFITTGYGPRPCLKLTSRSEKDSYKRIKTLQTPQTYLANLKDVRNTFTYNSNRRTKVQR
jgi:hypothetical protein